MILYVTYETKYTIRGNLVDFQYEPCASNFDQLEMALYDTIVALIIAIIGLSLTLFLFAVAVLR